MPFEKGHNKSTGRPSGSLNKGTQEIRAILAERIDFGVVVDKLYELVQGVTVQETQKNGDEIIYTRPPDSKAAQILLEYGFGKPSQSIDLTSGNEPLSLTIGYGAKED